MKNINKGKGKQIFFTKVDDDLLSIFCTIHVMLVVCTICVDLEGNLEFRIF